MTQIRPISPSFAAQYRRKREEAQQSANTGKAGLPVPVAPANAKTRPVRPLLDANLIVQLLAKPAPRGIRADQIEQARFHAAYARANMRARPARWQKTT